MTEEQKHKRMTLLCRTLPNLADREGFGLGWDTDLVFPELRKPLNESNEQIETMSRTVNKAIIALGLLRVH